MNWGVLIPVIIYLILVFWVGFYSTRYLKGPSSFLHEYFLGSRELGGFFLAMTMVATYASASSFIGGVGAAYTNGLGWVLLSMTQLVTGYFTLSILGKKFAIMARKINAATITDFLRERYQSKWVVILSAISIVIFMFSSMAAQWVGGGRLIQTMVGIPYIPALFIFAVCVLVYVIIGGFRAVVIADSIQGVVMLIGTVVILIGTIIAGGGLPHIFSQLTAENPNLVTPYGADHSLSPVYVSSFWILVGVGVVGLPQISVRAMSYRNSKAMHRAIIIGTFVVGFIMFGFTLTGVLARVVIPGVKVGDEVMPLLTLKILPSWLAGITLAAPMAAIMSTVNALLLVISSSIVKDLFINYIKPHATNESVKKLSFAVTTVIGILVFFMAIHPPKLLVWLNLFAFGGLEAAFIWPIVMGLYWKSGNGYGAFASIVTGVVSYIVFNLKIPGFFDGTKLNPFGLHPVIVPVVLSFVAYVLFSLLARRRTAVQQTKIISKFWSA